MSTKKPNPAQRLAALLRIRVLTRRDLHAAGVDTHAITTAVRAGTLIRLRRGRYVAHDVAAEVSEAVRIGGRVACVSLLQLIGIFVLDKPGLHVQVSPRLSRSRHRRSEEATMHWTDCVHPPSAHAVSVWDAVRQAVRCQEPRAAIATLDSVLHHRLLSYEQIRAVIESLPRRFHALLPLVDASAESGPETFVRLLLRTLGLPYETQVTIPGVGRVDFVVCGWLIIECDSREFHEGWDSQVADRHRDLAAARLGFVTIRPLAADIFTRQHEAQAAIKDVVETLGPTLGDRRLPQLRRNRRPVGADRHSGRRSAQNSGVLAG